MAAEPTECKNHAPSRTLLTEQRTQPVWLPRTGLTEDSRTTDFQLGLFVRLANLSTKVHPRIWISEAQIKYVISQFHLSHNNYTYCASNHFLF